MRRRVVMSALLLVSLALAPAMLLSEESRPHPAKGPLEVTYYFLPG